MTTASRSVQRCPDSRQDVQSSPPPLGGWTAGRLDETAMAVPAEARCLRCGSQREEPRGWLGMPLCRFCATAPAVTR